MITFSHATGNANVRAALEAIHGAGLLHEFHTTVATFPGNIFHLLGKMGPLKDFNRRTYPLAIKPRTRSGPWTEIGRMTANRLRLTSLMAKDTSWFGVDAVYRNQDYRVAQSLGNSPISGVYAYEDGAVETFEKAKVLGIQTLYELPTVYWRSSLQILHEQGELYPEWKSTMRTLTDSQRKLERKDAEIELADHLFVASSFVAETLKLFPGKLPPVHVTPYGFPQPVENRQYESTVGRPLKLLFVGSLSQRKGIREIFEAVDHFGKRVKLTIVGRSNGKESKVLDRELAKHNYIPSLPHAGVLKLMREHDLLLFPALCEGFGLVITEAMSQGTPVITTDRTAGRDLLTDGENGFIMDAGSEESLISIIENLLSRPRDVAEVGREACRKAATRPWSKYQVELVDKIKSTLAL
jgi:glycosyltransferase involved in cell wall biosynthesis